MIETLSLITILILFGGCFLGIYFGLSKIFGGGWALIIIDMLGHSATGGYEQAQNTTPASKRISDKVIGLLLIAVSATILYFFIYKVT